MRREFCTGGDPLAQGFNLRDCQGFARLDWGHTQVRISGCHPFDYAREFRLAGDDGLEFGCIFRVVEPKPVFLFGRPVAGDAFA